MLERIFKRGGAQEAQVDPAVGKLDRLGLHSAVGTLVKRADGSAAHEALGAVTFCRRRDRLFAKGKSLFLAPPEAASLKGGPLSSRGDVLNVRFYHRRVPYSLDCEVVQRVRFSDQLRADVDPHVPFAYRLDPMGAVAKEEHRATLRFAHLRAAKGPQAFPNLRLDLFVENLACAGPVHERPPEIVPYPGDTSVPEGLEDCESPQELVHHFRRTLSSNPAVLQCVHLTRISTDGRTAGTRLEDMGYTDVLGLKGEAKGLQIHLRNPAAGPKSRRPSVDLSEGDSLALDYIGRGWAEGNDTHYRWLCRVHKRGVETLVLRPRGPIRKQTGLRVAVRDFGVGGVCLQSGPLLEAYLLGDGYREEDPEETIAALTGSDVLLHFHPRLAFKNDLEPYCPKIPASFSLVGKIVRGRVEERRAGGHNVGQARELGVQFTHDPADYCQENLSVSAWEPLRMFRESKNFKEIHRSLNAMIAFLKE
jgi:hypothetical protein